MQKFSSIGIVYNDTFAPAGELAERIQSKYPNLKWTALTLDEVASAREKLLQTELVLAIGGDGTLLNVVQVVAKQGIPILGINTGHIGFLMELEQKDVLNKLDFYLNGECHIEERHALQLTISGAPNAEPMFALNEILLHRGAHPKTVRMRLNLHGKPFQIYQGDGLLVATATGSTAYALSLDCPLQDPLSDNFVLKPIAAASPNTESLVLSANAKPTIEILSSAGSGLTIDGMQRQQLEGNTILQIENAPFKVKFLRAYPADERWNKLKQLLALTKQKRLLNGD